MSDGIVLVRHAEPVRWARGRVIGRTDVGLSRAGVRQAEELARRLDAVERVISSPARRALDTARPIAAASGVVVEVDDDLREIDFGTFDGRTFASVRRERPELYRGWMRDPTSVHFPGGERWPSLRARVLRALARIETTGGGRRIAVVTHLGPILSALESRHALDDGRLFELRIEHASTHELARRPTVLPAT